MVTFKADSLNHIKTVMAKQKITSLCRSDLFRSEYYLTSSMLNMEARLFLNVEIFTLNNWTVRNQKNNA